MGDLDRRMLLGAAAGVAGVALVSRRARAGPLDPPSGPVSPTGRTMAQVEPRMPISPEHTPGDESATFTIRSPGSYCLTGDIVGESHRCAIKVELSTPGVVQIDMNGFTMSRGASEFLTAMTFTGAACRCLCLADGYLVGWGLDCFNVDFTDIDDVTVLGGEVGLRIRRSACIFDVEVTGVTGSGITWLRDSTATSLSLEVSDCVVRSCGAHGISVGGDFSGAAASLSIDDCDVLSCGGDGLRVSVSGFASSGGVVVVLDGVCASSCAGNGVTIEASPSQPGTVGVDCVVSLVDVDCVSNGACGVRCSNVVCDAECCVCTHNGTDGMRLENCPGCVCDCTAGWSQGDGISLSGYSGPNCLSECTDCTCVHNARGIAADGTVSCVCFEDNSLVDNSSVGMQVDGTGNLVVSNSCRGGSDPTLPPFLIAAGNMAGSVVSGPDALVISNNPNLNVVLGF